MGCACNYGIALCIKMNGWSVTGYASNSYDSISITVHMYINNHVLAMLMFHYQACTMYFTSQCCPYMIHCNVYWLEWNRLGLKYEENCITVCTPMSGFFGRCETNSVLVWHMSEPILILTHAYIWDHVRQLCNIHSNIPF